MTVHQSLETVMSALTIFLPLTMPSRIPGETREQERERTATTKAYRISRGHRAGFCTWLKVGFG
jgi:hypothetical protein